MRRLVTSLLAACAALALAGCPLKTECNTGRVRDDAGTCVCPPGTSVAADGTCLGGDAGDLDGSVDGGLDSGPPDMGPCGHACPGTTPVCLGDAGTCVECAGDGDCTTSSHGHTCETATHACVPCVVDSDCRPSDVPDGGPLDASLADGGAVFPRGAPVCESHACVLGCRTAADCGGSPCRADHRCSLYGTSQTRCMPCDDEGNCDATSDCVELMFMGTSDGLHCAQRASGACAGPYPTMQMRTSLEPDGMTRTYCLPSEAITTCDAVLSVVAGQSCAVATDCAARGAVCHDIGSGALQCTLPCGTATQCPLGFTCPAGFCHS